MPLRVVNRPATFALLTDFGDTDHFVGVLKAVLLTRHPSAQIIDISHGVEPGNIRQGAYYLWAAFPYLPTGTCIVAVVDPEVGSDRNLQIVRSAGRTIISPMNGLTDFVVHDDPASLCIVVDYRRISSVIPPRQSSTFHGRDIMAPLACVVVGRRSLSTFGKSVRPRTQEWRAGTGEGTAPPSVMTIDRFGNIITNIAIPDDRSISSVLRMVGVGKVMVSQHARTYGDLPAKTPGMVRGSSGLLEVVVRNGSAAALLHAHERTPIQVIWK